MKKILIIVGIVALILLVYVFIKNRNAASVKVESVGQSYRPVAFPTSYTGTKSKPSGTTQAVEVYVEPPSDVTGPTVGQLAFAAAAKRACEIKCDAKYPLNAAKRKECKAGC